MLLGNSCVKGRNLVNRFSSIGLLDFAQERDIFCRDILQTRPRFVSDKMIATAAGVVNACQTQTGVATGTRVRISIERICVENSN